MPFQRPTRPLSVLASALAAGLMLAAAGCSNITPLGPDPAPVSLPPARDLASPIIMQVMRSQPVTPAGECPAGSVALFGSEPGVKRVVSVAVPVQGQPRPSGHASYASPAGGGRSVLPSGRHAGNGDFRCSLRCHLLPAADGARRIRIRGRLSRRRGRGVDSGHQAGL